MDEFETDDERKSELSALAAIFPELQISPHDPYNASLDLEVTPIKPLRIRLQDTAPSLNGLNNGPDAPVLRVYELEHLPQLRINVQLPEGYPTEKPPTVNLTVSSAWLDQNKLDELKSECVRLWEEIGHDQVVYLFIDHLQSQTDDAFGLVGSEALSMSIGLQAELLDYDQKARRAKFEKGTFDCGICLEPKRGKDCHRLNACGHVFCVPCLQDYYNNCITEGDVDSVKCTDPGCGKETAPGEPPRKKRRRDHTLNPRELLQIPLEPAQVKRYALLIRKKKLESDKTTIYCPRMWCQGAAKSKKHPKPTDLLEDFISDDDSDTEPQVKAKNSDDSEPSSKLAVCEDCDFAFCCLCQKSWHGDFGRCVPRRTEEVLLEEKKTMAYLRHFSAACPSCAAPSQKTHGCNHMICFQCKTHFCYLCTSWLSPDDPYKHYNTEHTGCYQRLWELEGGDGEGAPGRGLVFNWDDPLFNDEVGQLHQQRERHALEMADVAREVAEIAANPVAPVVDDSDDEEVAPDVNRNRRRREQAIEFVNFAAPEGQQAQRVIIPDQIEEPAQPQADADAPAQQQRQGRNAARRRHERQRRQQDNQVRNGGRNARRPAGMPDPPARAPVAQQPPVADAVANADADADADADAGPGPRAPARQDPERIRRFFDAAQRDEEDGWASDDLPDAEGFDESEDSDDDDYDNAGADDEDVPHQVMRRIDGRERMNHWNMR